MACYERVKFHLQKKLLCQCEEQMLLGLCVIKRSRYLPYRWRKWRLVAVTLMRHQTGVDLYASRLSAHKHNLADLIIIMCAQTSSVTAYT